jgi:signal transduction histidine kinase/CheY-like chemotaxis protein
MALVTVLRQAQAQRCNQVVLVGDRQQPEGIISLASLLAYWPGLDSNLGSLDFPEQSHQPSPSLGTVLARHPQLLEPFLPVAESSTLAELRDKLAESASLDWILVDEDGGYLGLLEQRRLYPVLLQPSTPAPSPSGNAFEATTAPPVPAIELLTAFLELLYQLPLPLMVQTGDGQVLLQTPLWQQQIGQLQDLETLRHEATQALITRSIRPFPWEPSLTADASGTLPSSLPLSQPETSLATQPDQVLTDPSMSNLLTDSHPGPLPHARCQPGHPDQSCVCTCTLTDGQPQTWQFSRSRLGVLAARDEFRPGLHPYLQERGQSAFQLASFQSTRFRVPTLDLASLVGQEIWLVIAQPRQVQSQVASQLAAQNADLLHLNRLKDEFLACISHELKTPLTAVLGLSNLLREQRLGPLNERQAHYAQLIYQSGRHLILIVNDILDLTRIETNQLELNPEPVALENICQRAYDQARYQLTSEIEQWPEQQENREATAIASKPFCLEIQPGLETIVADELRLRQMLGNLLSNAIKFTPLDGEVGLRVENWEGWLAFTVWDTGIGIPANKQHLIFQKFQQLESPWTRKFEGTGLGLVLTQRLARLHGGDITFTSVEGKGSQFTLLLPPVPPGMDEGEGKNQIPAIPHPGENRLTMVVEAGPECLAHLTEQLSSLGYRVAIARSGTEALAKIRRLQPAIVFLNPSLPALSGWDLLTLLKSDPASAHIPVIITANPEDDDLASHGGGARADGFLALPVHAKALPRLLEQWVAKSHPPGLQELLAKLTVLHLRLNQPGASDSTAKSQENRSTINLNSLFAPYSCRVVEVDDLDQAELLAKVWKPNVILLDSPLQRPFIQLQQLAQSAFLASLPIVTLNSATTQVANQMPGLVVFPCLEPLTVQYPMAGQPGLPALAQVLLVAAGINWTPHILMVDCASLEQSSEERSAALDAPHSPQADQQVQSWLRAFQQYLTAAGLLISMSQSWGEVIDKLQHRSVAMVFLHCCPSQLTPTLRANLTAIANLQTDVPILVWADQHQDEMVSADLEFWQLLQAIAIRVLPGDLSISQLLEQIQDILSGS